jgi:chemotaxis protein methyltransferase CheR
MYFAPEYQAKVVAGLSRCLVDGGYLLVGAAETSSPLFESFVVEQISGVTAYRKASKPARVGTKIRPVVSVPEPPRPAARDAEPPASIALKVAESRPALPPERRVKVEAAASSTAAVPSDDLLVRARAYADTGLLDEALASCQDAIAADRTSAAARFLHATICHELGTHREEAIALGQVLYLDPDFVLAHRALGELHWRGGRPKEAKRHFTAALEILATKRVGDIVPESEGMTCGRLAESIKAMMEA